jgi:hypothetical protein
MSPGPGPRLEVRKGDPKPPSPGKGPDKSADPPRADIITLGNQSMQRLASSGPLGSSRIEAEAYLPSATEWAEREVESMSGRTLGLESRVRVGRQTDLAGTRTTTFEAEAVAADKSGGVRTATRISLTDKDDSGSVGISDLPLLVSSYPIEVSYRRVTAYLDQDGRQLEVSVTGTLYFTREQWMLGGGLVAAPDFNQLLGKRASAASYVVGVNGRDRAGTFSVTLTGVDASLRQQFDAASAALIQALVPAQVGQPNAEWLTLFLAPAASTGQQYEAIQRFFTAAAPDREAMLRALDVELAADVQTTKDKLLEERIDGDDERQLFDIAAKWAERRDAQLASGRTYFDEYLARLKAGSWTRNYLLFSGSSTNYLDSLFEELEERGGALLGLVARNSREFGDYVPIWDPAVQQGVVANQKLVKRAADQVLLGLKMRTSSADVQVIVDTMTALSGPTQAAVLNEMMSRYDETNWIGLGKYGEGEPEGMLYYLFEDLDSDGKKRLGKSLVDNGVMNQEGVDVLIEGRSWAGRNLPWSTTKAKRATEFWAKRAVEDDSKFAMVMGTFSSLWLPETAGATITTLAGARLLPQFAKIHPLVEGGMLTVGTGLSAYEVGIHVQEVVTGKDPYSGRKLTDEELLASKVLLFSSSLFLTAGFMQAPQVQQKIYMSRAPNFGQLPQGWQPGQLDVDPFTRGRVPWYRPFAGQGRQMAFHPESGEAIEISGAASGDEFTITRVSTGEQAFIGRGGAIRLPGIPLPSTTSTTGTGAPTTTPPGAGGGTGTALVPSQGPTDVTVTAPPPKAPPVKPPVVTNLPPRALTTPPPPKLLPPPPPPPKVALTDEILKNIEDGLGPEDTAAPDELDPKEFGPVARPVVNSLAEVDISDLPADVLARYQARYPEYAKQYLARGKQPPLRSFQDYTRYRYGKLTRQLPSTTRAGGGEGMSIEARLGIEQGHLAEAVQGRLRNTVKNTREYEVRFIDPIRGIAVIKTVIPDFMPTARTNAAGQFLSGGPDEALLIADSKMTWEEGNLVIDDQIRAMLVLAGRSRLPFVFLVGANRGISAGIQTFAQQVGAEIHVVQTPELP